MKPEIQEPNQQTVILTYKHYDEKLDDQFVALCRKDYQQLMSNVNLDTTDTMKSVLLMQSIQGHAMMGHCGFQSNNPDTQKTVQYLASKAGVKPHEIKKKKVIVRYPNTAIDDVIQAVCENNMEIRSKIHFRQQVIDEVFAWVKRVGDWWVKNKPDTDMYLHRLYTQRNEPLMRIQAFGRHTVLANPIRVIRGMYLGSRLDSAEWRKKTEKVFPGLKLHKGESYAVDRRTMKKKQLTLQDIANADDFSAKKGDIEQVLIDKPKVKGSRRYVCGFLETSRGYGVSDDAAWNFIALLWGIEAGFGFTLVDAIDTMDKCVPEIRKGGWDEFLGDYIKDVFKNRWIGIEDRDIYNMIYVASVDSENRRWYPSSSMRRFVEMDDKDYTALMSHIAFVRSIKEKEVGTINPHPIKLAYDQVQNMKFYAEFRKRMESLVDLGKMDYSSGHKQLLTTVYKR